MASLVSKTKDGHEATTFAWLADDQFVTEFRNKERDLVTVWEAPAIMSADDPRRIDSSALLSYHEANVAMWNDDGGENGVAEPLS